MITLGLSHLFHQLDLVTPVERVFLQHGLGARTYEIGWYTKVEFIVGQTIFWKGGTIVYNFEPCSTHTNPLTVVNR